MVQICCTKSANLIGICIAHILTYEDVEDVLKEIVRAHHVRFARRD